MDHLPKSKKARLLHEVSEEVDETEREIAKIEFSMSYLDRLREKHPILLWAEIADLPKPAEIIELETAMCEVSVQELEDVLLWITARLGVVTA
jgi:hypothetical protein